MMDRKEQRVTPDFMNDPEWMHEMCEKLRKDIDATIAQGISFEEICKLKVGEYHTSDESDSQSNGDGI